MKRFMVTVVSFAIVGLFGCSHKSTEVTQQAPAVSADQQYLSQAQREISDLQARLDRARDNASYGKFGANRQGRRQVINDAYARLGEAKSELRDLQTANSNDFSTRKARLEDTLAQLRSTLNNNLAE